jgi:hypothetical protein
MSRHLTSIPAVAILLALALPAAAQSDPDVLDKFSLRIGSFLSSSSTNLKVDGEVPGTEFNFEETLGLGSSKSLSRYELDWRFARKHTLSLGYYSYDRSRTDRIQGEIVFDDVVFPVDTVVESSLGLDFSQLYYTYWPYRTQQRAFGISGGLVAVSISAGLKNVPQQGEPVLDLEGTASTDLPVPGIGASYKQLFGESFLFDARANFIPTLSVGEYKGDTLNASAALEYRFLDHYAVGASYSFFGFRFELERPNFSGSLSYKIRGGQAYLKLYW